MQQSGFLYAAVQLVNRDSEKLSGLGIGDGALHEGAVAQALEPSRLLAVHRTGFLVRRAAPATTGEFIEEQPEQGVAEDAEVLAATGERLHTDAEHSFQLEELAPAHGLAVFADFRP